MAAYSAVVEVAVWAVVAVTWAAGVWVVVRVLQAGRRAPHGPEWWRNK